MLQPDQVVAENIGAEVQNQGTVSTTVTARTGRIVASEVQVYAGTSAGLSLVAGIQRRAKCVVHPPERGDRERHVGDRRLQPGSGPESVTVHLRLPSGPLAPLLHTVAPGSTWTPGDEHADPHPGQHFYSTSIEATGGPGVVVSRAVAAPATAQSPQAGIAGAFEGLSTASSSGEWIVPAPGNSTQTPVSNVAAQGLALMNTSGATEHFSATAVSATKNTVLVTGSLAPGATAN